MNARMVLKEKRGVEFGIKMSIILQHTQYILLIHQQC